VYTFGPVRGAMTAMRRGHEHNQRSKKGCELDLIVENHLR
jgi:hypothetical protein